MGLTAKIELSEEQKKFIKKAMEGKNLLVDACIGSGKTTAIQHLCNVFPTDKKILYLTYNRLLKIDAKNKIHQKNVVVTNYHGFAYLALRRVGKKAGVSDLIQTFNRENPNIEKYDVLIIDEYQDIDQELSELLEIIKNANPSMQIIAVGDMEQKIYDKTTLDVRRFIVGFLEDYETLEFTKCFRLSKDLAAMLGRVWKKKIVGVNDNCVVTEMCLNEVIEYLSACRPGDILCLGSRKGKLELVLNELEEKYPEKFNKKTVYASIRDGDSSGATEPKHTSAIFTTYDSSKGLERKICVLFDFTESYWRNRIEQPQTSYEILRNIFCVAASRGKEQIIFVKYDDGRLSEQTLSTYVKSNDAFREFKMSDMFDFKYKEDVEKCFRQLKISKKEQEETSIIPIQNKDELIDLSPCIGIYQEAAFFEKYNIDIDIQLALLFSKNKFHLLGGVDENYTLEQKILFLTSIETEQDRYRIQVETPFVSNEQDMLLKKRLGTYFSPKEEVQVSCKLHFANEKKGERLFSAIGYADVVKDDIVYELKYVSEVTHEHFLQCACYMTALNKEKGVLWNTRNNTMYEIEIPNKKAFLDCVVSTLTKGVINKYYEAVSSSLEEKSLGEDKEKGDEGEGKFAVIDVETTWGNSTMSVGVVIADEKSKNVIDAKYYLIDPEYKQGGMYSGVLKMTGIAVSFTGSRAEVIKKINHLLQVNGVKKILAYNASFDMQQLPELSSYMWCDIMRLAAYREYNAMISPDVECYGTGKMKRGYGVEAIMRMLSGNNHYIETHNAYYDALDELKIVRLLGHELEKYDIAVVNKQKTSKKSKGFGKEGKTQLAAMSGVYQQQITRRTEADNNKEEGTYTVTEVAEILNLSRASVYKLINGGELHASKRGNRYVIFIEDVFNYIDKKKSQQKIMIILAILLLIVIFIFFLKW